MTREEIMRQWQDLASGVDCPFDAPRPASNEHWDFIATLSVSSLYLAGNQTYRGYSLLVFDPRHAIRLDQLTAQEWLDYSADLRVAHDVLMDVTRPDHMNVELLGNGIPHLHWHLIPRRRSDERWGGPIWTTVQADMKDTRLAREDRAMLIGQLRAAVAARRR
jgi:diadenosine tetraphosphate (Ap4A) HIT family hydrolase